MGFLDWLTDGIGSDMGGSSIGSAMAPPMPQLGADAPPLAPPIDPATTDIAGGMQGGSPPLPPVPMPAPRPPGADAGPPPPLPPPDAGPGPSALPPNAAPAGGMPSAPPGPPNMPLPLAPGLGVGSPPPGFSTAPPSGATGFIGRALGLDANREASMRGSLGAGLKAAGENSSKPGLAAFAGSMGSGIEGGKAAADKTIDQQSKYLNDAIKERQAGDTGKLNIARTQLALAQAKAADRGDKTKASVMNSPEQLYLRGLGTVNHDPRVTASLAQLRSTLTQFGSDSKEGKAALAAHNALIDSTKKQVFATLGVNEKDAEKIGKQPGFASDNPVPSAGLTQEKFDALPPGAYFINPKDKRLLIK